MSADEFDIAIVGMSCRFPGAANVEEFWRNLAGGVESIVRLSDEDILRSGVPAAYLTRPSYVKAAPVLEEPGHFDAEFFGYSPMEARTMDPQQRILLELAYEALDDAGYTAAGYPGRVGVFMGSAMNTYFMNNRLNGRFTEEYIPTLIGNDKDFLSTRISYKLNLKGPSITVQSACSTSLVAVHMARQSLLSGETDMALAGAISVRVPHRAGYFADAGGVTSPDGHVRAFDAKANGTVFGSGGGIVVMKRLSDAIAAGDVIHAVLKGSAVNNDGAEKAGYTAPSVNSQADAVIEALANAGVDADTIGYIEAHGSGTPVGDPIEITALTKAFRSSTLRSGYCAIGSVKTNIGHLDAAAGIAGMIKSVLALKNRQIPPSLHFDKAGPEIDFPSTPFYVNTQLQGWTSDGPRRAGVMATGMGGTNAHVVLEEAPRLDESADGKSPHLLILSARTDQALDQATHRLRDVLDRSEGLNVSDVAYTLQAGRRSYPHRRFVVCNGRSDAIAGLSENSKRLVSSRAEESRRPLILLLPGVGDHFVGMAHDLYEHFDVFRSEVDRCARILAPHLGIDIRKIVYPESLTWKNSNRRPGIDLKRMLAGRDSESDDADSKTLNQPLHTQPVLFTIEFALARLWNELGIIPDAIVGHSMGEYVAACLSGVLSLEDALRLIVRRTQLVDQLPRGRMLAVTLSEKELLPLLAPGLSISLINGPSLSVVAGAVEEMNEFEAQLRQKNIICRPVQNTHAFHSRMLDPIVKAFEDEVRKVRLNEPNIPFVSNVTGTWVTKEEATDPAYWGRHTNHTARFSDALRTLWRFQNPILLESGPGRTIGVLAMQHPDREGAGNPKVFSSLRHHYENRNDVEFFLNSIGSLWASGLEIRWDNLHQGIPRRKVSLPAYPFERQQYWMETDHVPAEPKTPSVPSDMDHAGIENWFYVPAWKRAPFTNAACNARRETQASWLLFTDRRGTGLQRALERRGAVVHVAHFADEFRRRVDGSFEVDPANREDYVKLFREIKGELGPALNIIHLGCLAADHSQDVGFFSLLHVVQAIGDLGISVPVRVGVISSAIHDVTGEESLDPGMATVLGPVGVIHKEFPNVACFNVDLPGPGLAEDPTDRVVERILGEFTEPTPGAVLAYRGKYRWIRQYERVALADMDSNVGGHVSEVRRLRHRGVYLITGGTGGIGLAIARYLARTCQARLVLTKRTAFPEKARWKEVLTSKQEPESVLNILRDLVEIEDLGAEVEVFSAEASDPGQMRHVIDAAIARFGAIHGVIHGAGVVRAGLIQAKDREMARGVMAPKVQGTWVLHDLLAGVPLDFVVLFSSITSIITPYAESDYSGANAFLDAFASYSNAERKYPTLTINWPGWREVGQLANLETQPGTERWKQDALRKAIRTHDGVEAFKRILNSDFPQVVVSPENLHDLLDKAAQPFDPSEEFSEMPDSRGAAPSSNGVREADKPADEIETAIEGIWAAVFGHEHIGIHEQFSALGGHSLIAMQIVARVRSYYQVELSLADFFAAPTIAQLSSRVRETILQEIEALSEDEARQLVQTTEADPY